jgi:L-arabinose isomerase
MTLESLWGKVCDAQGPAHHCAIGVAHIATKFKKPRALLGMDCIRICPAIH